MFNSTVIFYLFIFFFYCFCSCISLRHMQHQSQCRNNHMLPYGDESCNWMGLNECLCVPQMNADFTDLMGLAEL